jgi:hypothetical protein
MVRNVLKGASIAFLSALVAQAANAVVVIDFAQERINLGEFTIGRTSTETVVVRTYDTGLLTRWYPHDLNNPNDLKYDESRNSLTITSLSSTGPSLRTSSLDCSTIGFEKSQTCFTVYITPNSTTTNDLIFFQSFARNTTSTYFVNPDLDAHVERNFSLNTYLTYTGVTPVPVPPTGLLFAAALVGLGAQRVAKRRST